MKSRLSRSARIPRIFHDASIATEQPLTLPKQASHHLVTVLRLRPDTTIELFNGDGYNYRATLVDTGQKAAGKCAELQVHERSLANTESGLAIELVQAISRGDKMDTTIRQCVELGVQSLQPVYSTHSAKALDEKRLARKMDHWQKIVISACEQSGRACLPVLAAPVELRHWLAGLSEASAHRDRLHIMLAPQADQNLTQLVAADNSQPASLSALIGPESGFDPDEIDLALQHGIQAVRFGPRILRTETAGPACVASLQSLFGDLGNALP